MASDINLLSESFRLGDAESFLASLQQDDFGHQTAVLAPNPTVSLGDILGGPAGGVRGLIGQTLNLGDANLLPLIESAVGDIDISRLEGVAMSLPPELSGSDATGEVPTGASSIMRPEAALGAVLSASARIVRAIGLQAETVQTEGHTFQVIGRYDDPATGFDAIHLRALDGPQDVFVTDGLEVGSGPDTLAALSLGRTQAASPEFARMIGDARDAALVDGRGLMFVGPSLGGALAQVAVYETAETLLAAGAHPGTGAIRLLTVDSLGGRDAAESLNGGSLNPAALDLINSVNLRTEGDLVSRISSHLGATISFQPVNSAGQPVELSTEEAHVNVESYLVTLHSDELFAAGKVGAPPEISGFAQLSNAASARLGELVLANGVLDKPEGAIPLQVPGTARFDETGTHWELDANEDDAPDLVVSLSAPVANASDLVFG
jgi:hypothetical protein